jgi:energy-coupling factor transport system ATP-binding protein
MPRAHPRFPTVNGVCLRRQIATVSTAVWFALFTALLSVTPVQAEPTFDETIDFIRRTVEEHGQFRNIAGGGRIRVKLAQVLGRRLRFRTIASDGIPGSLDRSESTEFSLLALAHLRNRAISTLSGGEQQRVAIGSALVMNPKVLVLDEPTSALDPIAAEEVLSILHRLVHDLSLTVVIAEHRLERVIGFADRIIHIAGDGSAEINLPEEILKRSDIAPPIVHLARALGLSDVGLSVRDVRRMTEEIRNSGKDIAATKVQLGDISISTQNLSLTYGEKRALNNVTTQIYQGEIVALMGRNGAGKSSLLTTLVGINKQSSGSSKICGFESRDLKGQVRRERVGFIPQEPSDLLYGQSVQGECQQADKDSQIGPGTTFALLQRIVPSINPETHPRDLSEGQRLALALAIVLSAQPQVLILDEPTRGLDYQSKALLVGLLKNFAKELNRSVLIATHDVELVAELCDRVIFLAEGEVVADGPTLDILLSSPAFAPQVAKVMAPRQWLTVSDVLRAVAE